jgi:hypothetical protein
VKVFKKLLIGLLLSGLVDVAQGSGAAVTNATQSVSGGGVTTKVTYLNPKSTDDARFQVVLDTHSVALDGYDLKTITVLRDDNGKTYLPTGVEDKGSGHHREATVSFPKISLEAKRLELVIKDVAGVKERTFRWNLE